MKQQLWCDVVSRWWHFHCQGYMYTRNRIRKNEWNVNTNHPENAVEYHYTQLIFSTIFTTDPSWLRRYDIEYWLWIQILQGATLILKCNLIGIEILITKIWWSNDRLIFMMWIPIPGKAVFIVNQGLLLIFIKVGYNKACTGMMKVDSIFRNVIDNRQYCGSFRHMMKRPDWTIYTWLAITQTPVCGSCCLPLGALQSMWATWCKT